MKWILFNLRCVFPVLKELEKKIGVKVSEIVVRWASKRCSLEGIGEQTAEMKDSNSEGV